MIYRTLLLISLTLAAVSLASAQTTLEDKFFDSNGVRVRYVEVGRGEPVMLIHGFTESLDAWLYPGSVFDVLADLCAGPAFRQNVKLISELLSAFRLAVFPPHR